MAARAIRSGDCDMVIAGGVESMTRAPFVMPKADAAFSRANAVYDTTIGWRFVNPKIQSAIRLAFDAGDRRQCRRRLPDQPGRPGRFRAAQPDALGGRAGRGLFRDEIIPVRVPQKKGDPIVVDTDEHPRPDTTPEQLAKLKGSTART